ncbi:oxaloacetate decarboxylase, alpha subunit [Klenkia soli]|uniref:Oxaloacetate decarboxylase, alpha subunit n=1 Tax=Klenkia soli TaxID=1052260 RepID=A0A1H0FXA7_9ACTN|nr:biotin carboxyl carrier protein [Klenkia soli]SDN99318.1 oxaloacetate decarboxylase, alpha subunit [Klenkia soli]
MSARRTVRLLDTSLRDGNQSLWGAAGLTTGMVEAVGPHLEAAGLDALDFTSSTHLSVGVRWHREDPWERISRMAAVTPGTPLSLITTGMRFMSWDRSPVSVMRMSMRALAEAGLRRLQIAEPMNDTAATLAVAALAKEEGIEQVVAAVTFTVSPVHDDSLYAAAAKVLAADPLIDRVYLKDPGGLLTPERTAQLIPELRAAVGDGVLELHSHCTTGLAPLVYVVAAQHGVDVLHTALGALANGTSQPDALRLVDNLAAVGIDTDVDTAALRRAAAVVDRIAQVQDLPPGRPTELDLAYQQHQIPGGMMGTLRRQLAERGQADLLPHVLEEVGQVREALGWPIMVTPYSQFIGTQAVLNVLAAQHGEDRWSRMPDEVLRYLLGHFGTPPGPVDPDVAQRAADLPRTRELDRPQAEPTVAELRSTVARQLGRDDVPDREVLLRTVLPADQLDVMAAAGPAPAWQPDRQPVTSGLDFVRAASELPHWRSLDITLGHERISLRRGAPGGGQAR